MPWVVRWGKPVRGKIRAGKGSCKQGMLAGPCLSGVAPWPEYKCWASLTGQCNISAPFPSHPFGSQHRDSACIVRSTLLPNRARGRPTDKCHPMRLHTTSKPTDRYGYGHARTKRAMGRARSSAWSFLSLHFKLARRPVIIWNNLCSARLLYQREAHEKHASSGEV